MSDKMQVLQLLGEWEPFTKTFKVLFAESSVTCDQAKEAHHIPVIGDSFSDQYPATVCSGIQVVSYGKTDLGIVREILCFMRISKRPKLDHFWIIKCKYRRSDACP